MVPAEPQPRIQRIQESAEPRVYLDSRPRLEAKISLYLTPSKPRKTALSSFACSAARSNNCLRCWLRSWAAAGAGAVGAWCVDRGGAVIARRDGVVCAISCRGPSDSARFVDVRSDKQHLLCARQALEFGVSVALRASL